MALAAIPVRSRPEPAAAFRFAFAGLLLAMVAPASAQDRSRAAARVDLPKATVKAAPIIGGKPLAPCVAVDIAGHRAGQVDCAAQALQVAATAAQRRATGAPDLAVPSATSHDVVTGVANQAAVRQRLGNNFGKSVYPQRPPPPVYVAPLRPKP